MGEFIFATKPGLLPRNMPGIKTEPGNVTPRSPCDLPPSDPVPGRRQQTAPPWISNSRQMAGLSRLHPLTQFSTAAMTVEWCIKNRTKIPVRSLGNESSNPRASAASPVVSMANPQSRMREETGKAPWDWAK